MKAIKKLLSLLLTVALVAAFAVLPASAVSFSGGKGTASNPYIITTAEQLNSIRDNLSAHYKLGANIDLSGIDWKAIGTWKKAFTGSLTCDVDSTGKPLYAISNLTCTVAPVQPDGKRYDDPDYRYGDYQSDGSSGWEAGLFGVCNRATIRNIVLLNVNITNHAQGRSQQENYQGQVVNNPVWQMCTGGLAGTLISSKVTNCGVTGKVSGESNHMGGFVGNVCGSSTVKQCYAIVDVTGTGEWYTGGFVGSTAAESEDAKLIPHSGTPTISECYSEGYVTGGWCNTGGFVGGTTKGTAVFSDCYNRGTAKDPSSGRSFFGQDPKNTTKGCEANFSNCYTLAGLDGKGKASTAKGKADCFVGVEADSRGNYPYQNGFTAADMATICNAFKANSLWTVHDGTYPELKNVKVIRSLSDLGKIEEQPSSPTMGTEPTEATDPSEETKPAAPTNPTEDTQPADATDPTDGGSATDPTAGTPDPTTGTKDNSIDINTTVYDNTAQMGMAEMILVIVLLALIAVTLTGSIITIILMLKRLKK